MVRLIKSNKLLLLSLLCFHFIYFFWWCYDELGGGGGGGGGYILLVAAYCSYNSSNPPSASIIEEATIATAMAFSGVYNNLLIFDQGKPTNGFDTIQPELAESWAWDDSRPS